MAKTDVTKQLESIVFHKYFIKNGERCAFEVSFVDRKNEIRGRVDFVAMDREGRFTFVEIKQSVSDFNSKTGHNLYGDKNYYAMPLELYEKVYDKISKGVGVMVIKEHDWTHSLGYIHYEAEIIKRCSKIAYKLTPQKRERQKKDM
jgi:hypothetical protein